MTTSGNKGKGRKTSNDEYRDPSPFDYAQGQDDDLVIFKGDDRCVRDSDLEAWGWEGGSGMTGRERLARWAGMGNNRRGSNDVTSDRKDRDMNEQVVEQDFGRHGAHVEEGTPGAIAEPMGETNATQVELEQLKSERDQLLDRLARLQAEFDNARKREIRERADARDYTITNTVEPFLGVMDNFQLALKADGTAEQLRAGVELILKQMEDALKGLNVQPVETVGTQFDPRVHEALGSIETKEFPDHQVLEEIRRGYKIRDKLLRPALVRIAANAEQVAD
jgi:molecular chaperone GrpE